MADHKKVIMQFKKTASSEERAKLMDDLKAKGAQVTNDDNINSRVMPFVSLALPEDHFDALRSESLGGDHKVVENVGRSSFHLRRSPLIRCRGGHGDADSMRAGGVGDAENE